MPVQPKVSFFSKAFLSLSLAGGLLCLTQKAEQQDVRRLEKVKITGAKNTPAFMALRFAHSVSVNNQKLRTKDSFQLKSGELEPIKIELAAVKIKSSLLSGQKTAHSNLGYKVGTHLLASLNPDLSYMLEPQISYNGPKLQKKASSQKALANKVWNPNFKTLKFSDGKKVVFSRGGLSSQSLSSDVPFKFDPLASTSLLRGLNPESVKQDIKVKVQLVRGAVYLGQDYKFYLDHYIGQRLIRSGRFQKDDFSFQVPMSERQGELRAELRHLSGAVVAHGRIDLETAGQKNLLTISLSPTEEQSLVGHVAMQDLSGESLPPAEGRTQINIDALAMGRDESEFYSSFSFSPSQPGSMYLTSFHHTGFEAGAGLFEAGSYKQVELVPEYIKNKIKEDLGVTGSKGWIIGQVNKSGRALSDVQVYLTEDPSAKIYYFDGQSWGVSNKGTYSNGLYLIKVTHEALYTLVGRHSNHNISSELVWGNHELTTAVNLEAAVPTHEVQVRATDAFSNQDISAKVISFDQEASANNELLKLKNLPGLIRMNVLAQNDKYLDMGFVASRRSRELLFPLVQKAWFHKIKKDYKLDQNLAIGYFNEKLYQPYIDENPYSEKTQSPYKLVYFNAKGEIVDQPVAFGGFILSHRSRGTSTVVLKPLDSSLDLAQTHIMDTHQGQISYISVK